MQTAQSTLNTAHCTAIIAHFTFSGVQNAFCFAVSCEGGGKRDVFSRQRQGLPSVIGGSLVFGKVQSVSLVQCFGTLCRLYLMKIVFCIQYVLVLCWGKKNIFEGKG